MEVNTIKVIPAEEEKFKLFNIQDNSSCKLEFYYNIAGYVIKYCNQDYGVYSTNNPDKMILRFFEKLAEYNNGDSTGVKTKLDNLVEQTSPIINQQYQTSYKNNTVKYLLGLEHNLIKSACIELKITYQKLADVIGVSESSLRSSVSTNKVSRQVEKSIHMYLQIIHLEKELEKSNTIKTILKSWLN